MIPTGELQELARGRLNDARALLRSGRYDGAAYLSGYAVELALKARTCRALRWSLGFPSSRQEFEGLASFRTHELSILLKLSGTEARIESKYLNEWSVMLTWSQEWRYRKIGEASLIDAERLIGAASKIVKAL